MPFPTDSHLWRAALQWQLNSSGPIVAVTVLWFVDTASSHSAADLGSALDSAFNDNQNVFDAAHEELIANTVELRSRAAPPPAPITYTLETGPTGNAPGDLLWEGAAVVTHQTALAGRRYRGRTFVGPIGEGAQASGQIGSDYVTDMTAAWNAWRADMADADFNFVVASQKAGGHVEDVVNSIARPYLATQRQRLIAHR